MGRGWLRHHASAVRSLVISAAIAICGSAPSFATDPIKIGQVAALSGASAQSGEAITRGLSLAIDEINATGGLLGGRMLELVQRDDELNSAQGLDRCARTYFTECGGGLRRHRHAGFARDGAGA